MFIKWIKTDLTNKDTWPDNKKSPILIYMKDEYPQIGIGYPEGYGYKFFIPEFGQHDFEKHSDVTYWAEIYPPGPEGFIPLSHCQICGDFKGLDHQCKGKK